MAANPVKATGSTGRQISSPTPSSAGQQSGPRVGLLPCAESAPALFYAGMFLVMFEVMNLFDDGHAILRFLDHAAKNIL